MRVLELSDWGLEDRLAAGGPTVLVLFRKAEGRNDRVRRADFRRFAEKHPEAAFYEVDLVENPSLEGKYSVPDSPVVVVFSEGAEVARHSGPIIAPMILRVLGPWQREGD